MNDSDEMVKSVSGETLVASMQQPQYWRIEPQSDITTIELFQILRMFIAPSSPEGSILFSTFTDPEKQLGPAFRHLVKHKVS